VARRRLAGSLAEVTGGSPPPNYCTAARVAPTLHCGRLQQLLPTSHCRPGARTVMQGQHHAKGSQPSSLGLRCRSAQEGCPLATPPAVGRAGGPGVCFVQGAQPPELRQRELAGSTGLQRCCRCMSSSTLYSCTAHVPCSDPAAHPPFPSLAAALAAMQPAAASTFHSGAAARVCWAGILACLVTCIKNCSATSNPACKELGR